MKHQVKLTDLAQRDLLLIAEYYVSKAGKEKASQILNRIVDAIKSLEKNPLRGHKPHELIDAVADKYLEIISNPYRIIYRINSSTIFIIAIFDGRQNVKAHLNKRIISNR